MENNEPIDIKKINFYKIGFAIAIILLAFFLGVVFHGKFVSASWPLDKAGTCAMFNVTGSSCDQTWCGIIDCPYNSSLEACLCTSIINETIYINQTINNTIYVNVTSNFTDNATILNNGNAYNKTEVDNMFLAQRDSYANRTDKLETAIFEVQRNSNTYTTSGNSLPWYAWALIVAIIMGGLVWIVYQNNNKKQEIQGQQLRREFKFAKKEEQKPVITKTEEIVNTETKEVQQQPPKKIPWYLKIANKGSEIINPTKQEKAKPKKKKKEISEEEKEPIEEMPEEEFDEEQGSEIE